MKKGISQEWLKCVACFTMLLDHIGAVLVPGHALRILGRISFPIYCFLLSEGFSYSKDRRRYGIRLLIGAAISEMPFDLVFYGGIDWRHQSVMVTLLAAFVMLNWMEKWGKTLPLLAAAFTAELLCADYGGFGVVLVALFHLTREETHRVPIQMLGMAGCFWMMDSAAVPVLGLRIPIQMFGLAAMVPIMCYSGEKKINGRAVQWVFYLFYPVHLLVLYGIIMLWK